MKVIITMAAFGETIRLLREDRGLTATECASRAEMPISVWSEWENGRSRRKDGAPPQPTKRTCRKIAHGLGVPEGLILRAAGYAANEEEVIDQRDELLLYFGDLTHDDQERLLTMARALAELRRKENRSPSPGTKENALTHLR